MSHALASRGGAAARTAAAFTARGDPGVAIDEEGVTLTGERAEWRTARRGGDARPRNRPATLVAIRAFALDATADFARSTRRYPARVAQKGGSFRDARAAHRAAGGSKVGDDTIRDHGLTFVARACDEARGLDAPRAWSAERDRATGAALQG